LKPKIKVAFASGTDELNPRLIERAPCKEEAMENERKKDLELCWQRLAPLVERAFRLVAESRNFRRQDERLNKLALRAKSAVARGGYPQVDGEPHWTVVRAIDRMRSDLHSGPQVLWDEAPAAFEEIRRFVPAKIVHTLEEKIDRRFIKRTCEAIVDAAQKLHYYTGLPEADSHALSRRLTEFPSPLVEETEIDALAVRVREMEDHFRQIGAAEQECR
jgi:hypothetical protein